MWRTNRFWITFIIYTIICIALCLMAYYVMGIIAIGDDISNEERASMTGRPMFLIRYIFGFPLSIPMSKEYLASFTLASVILLQAMNCFIQLSLLFFLWQKIKPNKKPTT
ncbi:MAG TPA: hypothetical protein VHM26_07150 [Chitinophagaceae bacterium]|jgi:hypothetical protein|nr:hypothetical protein [Chitinophagaceae bacterium]